MRITNHLDSDKQHLNGVEVELVRIVREPEHGFDEEVLPMVYVRLIETGGEAKEDSVLLLFPDELDTPIDQTGN